MDMIEIYKNTLMGAGLLTYLVFSSYSIFLLYTTSPPTGATILQKGLYWLGAFQICVWVGSFTLLLLLKIGSLL